MFIATKTVTRYIDGKGSVTLVKGQKYDESYLAKFPSYYKEWVTV